MWYIIASLLGMFAGGVCIFLALEYKRLGLEQRKREQDAQATRVQEMREELRAREVENSDRVKEALQRIKAKEVENSDRVKEALQRIKAREMELNNHAARLKEVQSEFDSRIISYKELGEENAILKRDLRNIGVSVQKGQLDGEVQRQAQEALDQRAKELGSRYLKENVKWNSSSLTSDNFAKCKQRLLKVIESCRGIGFGVTAKEEEALLGDLKEEYERIVRAALEREEQARIKAQIREEQKLEKEIERELKQLDRERAAVQAALEKALAEAKDEHSAEVERLRAKLTEAEERSQRALSRAQMTKSGHVYVISNIGSFGEGIFKIGMTRRLEPMERVKELGDASVPFPFDVHMMVSSDDAPALENAIHRTLHKLRLNKTNPRKEFFRTDVEAIHLLVEEHHGEVEYVVDAEALEYRQTLAMSDEDQEYIEGVFEKLDDERGPSGDEQ